MCTFIYIYIITLTNSKHDIITRGSRTSSRSWTRTAINNSSNNNSSNNNNIILLVELLN